MMQRTGFRRRYDPQQWRDLFNKLFMEERPYWNRFAKDRLPEWFKERCLEIDPDIVFQFMVPMTVDYRGCDPTKHPDGVWAICKRLPLTRWLHKRWLLGLYDDNGRFQRPSHETLKALRRARDHWRRDRLDILEQEFDREAKGKNRQAERDDENWARTKVEKCMSWAGLLTHAGRMVSMHSGNRTAKGQLLPSA